MMYVRYLLVKWRPVALFYFWSVCAFEMPAVCVAVTDLFKKT